MNGVKRWLEAQQKDDAISRTGGPRGGIFTSVIPDEKWAVIELRKELRPQIIALVRDGVQEVVAKVADQILLAVGDDLASRAPSDSTAIDVIEEVRTRLPRITKQAADEVFGG